MDRAQNFSNYAFQGASSPKDKMISYHYEHNYRSHYKRQNTLKASCFGIILLKN